VALGIQEQFEQQLTALEEFPRICQRNIHFPEVFDFKLKGLPYIISYEMFQRKRVIEILAVSHEREDRTNADNHRY
jgi:plasmid stabilization system protein ParE